MAADLRLIGKGLKWILDYRFLEEWGVDRRARGQGAMGDAKLSHKQGGEGTLRRAPRAAPRPPWVEPTEVDLASVAA